MPTSASTIGTGSRRAPRRTDLALSYLSAVRGRRTCLGPNRGISPDHAGGNRSLLRCARRRSVPIPERLVPALQTRLDGRSPAAPAIASPKGSRLGLENWKRSVSWKHAVASMGREKLRVHDLRHGRPGAPGPTVWPHMGPMNLSGVRAGDLPPGGIHVKRQPLAVLPNGPVEPPRPTFGPMDSASALVFCSFHAYVAIPTDRV